MYWPWQTISQWTCRVMFPLSWTKETTPSKDYGVVIDLITKGRNTPLRPLVVPLILPSAITNLSTHHILTVSGNATSSHRLYLDDCPACALNAVPSDIHASDKLPILQNLSVTCNFPQFLMGNSSLPVIYPSLAMWVGTHSFWFWNLIRLPLKLS